ncbi:MAG: hypothetical protein BJ554DRAFT_3190 [Olpidium bornovanus]|uniref:Uncharacterized protein n=1 Tax=Olpidium bornovanus TaxID=278681 RepID=A0A8H7ZPF9_9FUNG|nr:MAG: hypothetical protein BJ554DRAFT_3190 [Olpidium bornovanus]
MTPAPHYETAPSPPAETTPSPSSETAPPPPVEVAVGVPVALSAVALPRVLTLSANCQVDRVPYYSSFAYRLFGDPRLASTLTAHRPWTSPWHGRKLRPYIWRDQESSPMKARMLEEIQRRGKDLDW